MSEISETIRKRVQAAREIQQLRFTNHQSPGIIANADMRIGEIRQFCQLQAEGVALSRVEVSGPDALCNESTAIIRASISPHPEIIPHHCRSGWQ